MVPPFFIRPIRSRRCSLRFPSTLSCRTYSWPDLLRSPLITSWRDASRSLSRHRFVSSSFPLPMHLWNYVFFCLRAEQCLQMGLFHVSSLHLLSFDLVKRSAWYWLIWGSLYKWGATLLAGLHTLVPHWGLSTHSCLLLFHRYTVSIVW